MSCKEEEFEDIEDVNNGLILSSTFFPEEILVNLLIFVDWKDFLSCRLVCRTWRRLIDSVVCFKKLKTYHLTTASSSFTCPLSKLKPESIPFYLYFAISNGAFGRSMLKNAFGSGDDPHVCHRDLSIRRDQIRRPPTGQRYFNSLVCGDSNCPKYQYWRITQTQGDGWTVEAEPEGCEPLPEHLGGRSCFVTSYLVCEKEQLITLAEYGLTAKIMDEIRPHLVVSEWFARRWDCGVMYRLHVSLLNINKEVVNGFEFEFGEDLVDSKWYQHSYIFTDYGPCVRYVLFQHAGKDTQYWAGHYGSKMAGGSVIAQIPSTPFERNFSSSL